MPSEAPAIADFRRIVVKVGSSLLVDSSAGQVKEDWLASLAEDIARLHKDKRDVLVVSSGAIALGRAVLRLANGPLRLEDSQAAAAVGQIALARTWSAALDRHDITAGQVLVTLYEPTRMQMVASVRESLAHRLKVGDEVPARVDSMQRDCFATVSEIGVASPTAQGQAMISTATAFSTA